MRAETTMTCSWASSEIFKAAVASSNKTHRISLAYHSNVAITLVYSIYSQRAFDIRFNFSDWHNKAALKNIYNSQVQFKCWAKSAIWPSSTPFQTPTSTPTRTPGKNEGPHIKNYNTECFFFILYFSVGLLLFCTLSIFHLKATGNWCRCPLPLPLPDKDTNNSQLFGWPRSECWHVNSYFFFCCRTLCGIRLNFNFNFIFSFSFNFNALHTHF